MELIKYLNDRYAITFIMVLHDLNQAILYSDQIVIMKEGLIYQYGTPDKVINANTLKEVFGVHAQIEIEPDEETCYSLNKIK
ncbi:ATP-binding cassette domain-containing protein [Risungbinella massiliensis]|uniref:ABC transporter ATP-binding protein n=1 Tax=Risungbinella massiliensis TaxID=1329796 RepID=UPI00069BCA89|nr:ABC transporter ATP-binding protein [Risungbinella massiliensis]